MYRILYCVVPLALAVPAYLLIEARLRGTKNAGSGSSKATERQNAESR